MDLIFRFTGTQVPILQGSSDYDCLFMKFTLRIEFGSSDNIQFLLKFNL